MIVAPSILSIPQTQYLEIIHELERENITVLHLDVMDGIFVPNITFDETMISYIKQNSILTLDVHLMIHCPATMVDEYVKAGADIITFHYEAAADCLALIQKIHYLQKKVGISIKPHTDVTVLEPFLPLLDLILVMSVEPGYGGQPFLISSLDKIHYLARKKYENHYSYVIEVDGGMNLETAKLVKKAGADMIVVGSFLMKQANRRPVIEELQA